MVSKSKSVKKISGGEALIKSLIDLGVKVIFGIPGGALLPTYDVLYRYSSKIRHILCYHEQGAAHSAEGYARASGKVGVCLVTSGPGATNLVTGICDAYMDSVPIVCITGQVPTSVIGTDAFQEVDIIGITAPVTKWNYQVTKAEEIPEVLAKAFYIAGTGRPGPVLIDLPKDVQIEEIDNYFLPKKVFIESYQPTIKPHIKQIKLAAELLNKAKRPYVLAGHGILISRAEKELKKFVEKGGYPVAATLHGISALPADHPLFVGFLGMHGNYGPNILTSKADVILAIGMRFDDRVTGKLSEYAKNAKIIHIDIDPAELNKNVKTEIPIVSDVKEALKELIKHIKKASHSEWLEEFKKYERIEKEKVTKKALKCQGEKIKMAYLTDMLSKKTEGKALIVSDVGQNQMLPPLYYKFKTANSLISSGGLAPMGFGLPAAIGAKLACPKREVIALLGDGGFQMTIQELATIKQQNLPVKIIVLNNSCLGMIRQWQEMFYKKRYSHILLKNPDFVKVCDGYGIKAERVSKVSQLSKALKRLISAKESYLLDVLVKKEDNILPMVPAGATLEEIILE